MYSIAFSLNVLIGEHDPSKFKPAIMMMGMFNLSGVILLWSLIYFAIHYFENYKKVEIESYIWEAAVKDFELKTLKSQLNPHFMFNALNSIRALIREDPQNAQIAVTKLSSILRYSLKIERSESVPLDEEMQTVADYLSLESIRFEERLKYKINIDPKSAKIEIPPMMIQTLVENGIKHGISKRTDGGEIIIDSSVKDSKLHIEIKNSGSIREEDLKNSKGFGINNTKHRLNLIYGEKALFAIKNSSNDQVLAEIVIPTGGTNK
jgi:LytS/YehU family sensor histidine kinase